MCSNSCTWWCKEWGGCQWSGWDVGVKGELHRWTTGSLGDLKADAHSDAHVEPNCQLPTANCQLPTANSPTANCQLPTANSPTANCQLPTANCQLPQLPRLPTPQLPTANSPTANCQLPNCQLPAPRLPWVGAMVGGLVVSWLQTTAERTLEAQAGAGGGTGTRTETEQGQGCGQAQGQTASSSEGLKTIMHSRPPRRSRPQAARLARFSWSTSPLMYCLPLERGQGGRRRHQ